ncbi:MAG: histidinol-phosphatase HisJ family protein [Tenuifilaceae bacterium]|jgi:histidinol-phosphatase (PHP family)|nr:histidinol-phosphatase HisJ family protein [Tenuifilaceae bacterium]
MIDYHMHTYFSDGKNSHEEMLTSAAYKGLSEIGFSDHICLKPVGWATKLEAIPAMRNRIISIKEDETTPIKVKFGAEVDYIPGLTKGIGELITSLPLDYCIGSVHFIDDWNFDTDIAPYDGIDIDAFYNRYFALVEESAKSGLFDIIGHADLAKKFAYYPSFDLNPYYEHAAKVFKEANVVVEVNTSGRIKPCKEFYPSAQFVNALVKHRVPLTLGSDAHVEQNVGQFFADAINELRALGVKELVRFTNRKREFYRID